MLRFKNYVRAESLKEAYELNQKKSSILAGGMMWLKLQDRKKMTLIDLTDLGLDQIEETEDEFRIGCMCSLRTLETHSGLRAFYGDLFSECTKAIVGIQFRNGATVGGSVFGRFGFSDILTCLMVLDTYVELYQGGIVSLAEFSELPHDRDILVRIIIKKDSRKGAYASQRKSSTDFPVIACGVAKLGDDWYTAVGARPSRAKLVVVHGNRDSSFKSLAKEAAGGVVYGTNMRGTGEYRQHLAEVYIRRMMEQIEKEDKGHGN